MVSGIPIVQRALKSGVWHRLLDRLVGVARGRFRAVPYYEQGWGDLSYPTQVLEWLDEYAAEVKARGRSPPPGFDITWTERKDYGLKSLSIMEGKFTTPSTWIDFLQEENRTGYVLSVKPSPKPKQQYEYAYEYEHEHEHRDESRYGMNPTVILLAGTGDHGFSRRLRNIAAPLAKEGVSSLILESPYYGRRRTKGQVGSKLKTVSDLGVLGRVTIEETLALLQYSMSKEGPGPYAVCGISMGGLHSVMVASLSPCPCGAVGWLAPTSASPVFSEGLLSEFCDWKGLRRVMPKPSEDPKKFLQDFLSFTDIENFSPPQYPEHVSIVAAKHDLYVPKHAYSKWQKLMYEKWRGGEFSWIHGGHVSGSVFRYRDMRERIMQVISRMNDKNHLAF